jgi:hypothetical protein
VTLAAAVPVAVAAWGRRDAGAVVCGGLAIGLAAVSAVRDSEWLSVVCLMAAGCLAIAAVLEARTWAAVLRCVPAFSIAVLRSLPWLSVPRRPPGGAPPPADPQVRAAADKARRDRKTALVNGVGVGLTAAVVVGLLLASADAAFAQLFDRLVPDVDLDLADLGTLPVRVLWFCFVGVLVLGGVYGARSDVEWPKRLGPHQVRHIAEWLTPLVLVGAVIALFLAVQATLLFGGADVVFHGDAASHASRARQGFGQLFVVTLIVLGLLAWAGRAADRGGTGSQRRVFGLAGGALTAMTLALAVSALRRLWLYQEQYGATVTRIVAGTIEIWVAFLLLAIAGAWLLRRVDAVPRLVITSAGAFLLAMSLAGPDAVAASWNVHRFEETGKIDTGYLGFLSDDAVPALQRLPEAQRACALLQREPVDDGWTTWNWSRSRAAASLRERPAPAVAASSCQVR